MSSVSNDDNNGNNISVDDLIELENKTENNLENKTEKRRNNDYDEDEGGDGDER